jgi:hypothetical protein
LAILLLFLHRKETTVAPELLMTVEAVVVVLVLLVTLDQMVQVEMAQHLLFLVFL